MVETLGEDEWELLLHRIRSGRCTPFLGAGACDGSLPLGKDIAAEWAQKHGYPLEDWSDLARVAQFLAVTKDPMFPKEELLRRFRQEDCTQPDFTEPDEPHGVLADLPVPIYLTTNYDDFMVKALQSRHRDCRREICCWNEYVDKFVEEKGSSVFDREEGFEPTVANPVVFHLHGHDELYESLVLTEDDYLDFLVRVSSRQGMLPPRIRRALTGASLLFIGYQLADWDFRVLLRGLVGSMEGSLRRINIAVQLLPVPEGASRETQQSVQEYLDRYFGRDELRVRVYWGTARQFAGDLRSRWEKLDGS